MDKRSIYKQEGYAEKYDEDRYGREFGRYLKEFELNNFISLLDSSYNSILDLGSGTGKIGIPLTARFPYVVIMDLSLEMIRVAKRRAKDRNIQLVTVLCDAERLCFKDKTFDCVVSSRLLMHLNDWRKGIAEICRVSKRDVILDYPPKVSFGFPDSLLKQLISHKHRYRTFLTRDVANELQNNNFKMIKLTKQIFLPFAFHRLLDRPRLSSKIENFFRKTGLVRFMGSTAIGKAVRTDR